MIAALESCDPYGSLWILAPVAFACFSNSHGTIHAFDKTSQQAKKYKQQDATSPQIKDHLKVFKLDYLQDFANFHNNNWMILV